MLRRIPSLGRYVMAGEGTFVLFIIYGLAFSLISSAATVIRKKDAVILVLAAGIIWGVFLEAHLAVSMIRCLAVATCVVFAIRWLPVRRISKGFRAIAWRDVITAVLAVGVAWGVVTAGMEVLGMVRFIAFAALVTVGLLIGRGVTSGPAWGRRVILGTVVSAVLCGAGGLIYSGLTGGIAAAVAGTERPIMIGPFWGFSLGLAVGLGVSIGSEMVEWMARKVT
jgi:hypothetical protein